MSKFLLLIFKLTVSKHWKNLQTQLVQLVSLVCQNLVSMINLLPKYYTATTEYSAIVPYALQYICYLFSYHSSQRGTRHRQTRLARFHSCTVSRSDAACGHSHYTRQTYNSQNNSLRHWTSTLWYTLSLQNCMINIRFTATDSPHTIKYRLTVQIPVYHSSPSKTAFSSLFCNMP